MGGCIIYIYKKTTTNLTYAILALLYDLAIIRHLSY